MKLFIDVDSRTIIDSLTYQRATPSISLKRRDNMKVDVVFVREGKAIELASGALGRLGIKVAGDYGGGFIASATSWTKTGTGEDTIYSFSLSLNTTEMNTAFDEEPDSVEAMLEITWTEGAIITSTNTLPATIQNDVIRGNESSPIAAGGIVRVSMTSDYELPLPTGEYSDGKRIEYWITNTDSTAHNLSLNGAIVLPTTSTMSWPATIESGKKAKLLLEYDSVLNGGQWELTTLINGY